MWGETVPCRQRELSRKSVLLLVNVSCEHACRQRTERRGGMAAPHPLAPALCWWCLRSSSVRSRVPLFTYVQLENGVHCQGRHGAELPSVSGKWQLQISRPFTLWGSENRGVQALLSLSPSPEISVEMIG